MRLGELMGARRSCLTFILAAASAALVCPCALPASVAPAAPTAQANMGPKDLNQADFVLYMNPPSGGADIAAKEVNSARKSIWLLGEAMSVPLAAAILDADTRGVDVQVVVPQYSKTLYYNGLRYRILPNVKVFVYPWDNSPDGVMIIDGVEVLRGRFSYGRPQDRVPGTLELIRGVPKIAHLYEESFLYTKKLCTRFVPGGQSEHPGTAEKKEAADELLRALAAAVKPVPPEPRRVAQRGDWGLDIRWPQLTVPGVDLTALPDTKVTLEWDFDKNGTPMNVKISDSSGNARIDLAARQAIEGLQYRPCLLNGDPQVMHMFHTFVFGNQPAEPKETHHPQ